MAENVVIGENVLLDVCTYCGVIAGASAHGHSNVKWDWKKVEYTPVVEEDRVELSKG